MGPKGLTEKNSDVILHAICKTAYIITDKQEINILCCFNDSSPTMIHMILKMANNIII